MNDTRVHHYGWDRLHWEENKLFFQEQELVELIPSEMEKHWHLKFIWRDTPTSEFFNIFNARENARIYALRRLNQDTWQKPTAASLVRLNEKDVCR